MISRPELRKPDGFTLIEVLLAMALGSIIMVSAAALISNISEVYYAEQEKPSHDVHARNVGRFMENLFYTASLPPTQPNSNNNQNRNQQATQLIQWEALPGDALAEKDYLSFEYQKNISLFYWEDGPLPALKVWMLFEEGEGLFLLWQTMRQQKENPDEYFRSLVSEHVTAMDFQYYDEDSDQWEENEDFMDSQKPLPDIITFTFEWDEDDEDKTDTINVLLPPEISGAPLY